MKWVGCILAMFLTFITCTDIQSVSDRPGDREYQYAYDFLRVYLIFQERLPDDPFQYNTPQELYQSVNEPYTAYLTKEQFGGFPSGPSLLVDSVDTNIACIFLRRFSSAQGNEGGTAGAFDSALTITSWASMMILDLRGNPGGEIVQAIGVISEFLPSGTPIVKTRERVLIPGTTSGKTVDSVWNAFDAGNDAIGRTWFFLVNDSTASAAEMLVARLQESETVTSIGQTTFGKARAQILSVTPDSALVSVTYALIRLPDGTSYDGTGVVPEVVIADDEDAMEKAITMAKGMLERESLTNRSLFTEQIITCQ